MQLAAQPNFELVQAMADSLAALKGDSDWQALRSIIRDRSFSRGAERMLVSGAKSNFYFDMKKTLADPKGATLVAKLMLRILRRQPACDFVGGLEMGAVPISTSIMLLSYADGAPVPYFWVRKKPKEHGTQALVEGPSESDMRGKHAVVVEDVTTTGDSSLKAVLAVRAAGCSVDTILTIVDRQEGATDNLARHGLRLIPLFTAGDFL